MTRHLAETPFRALAGAPLAIAHRGGAFESPENTLVAFQHAYDLGFGYMETDVRATSDDVVVAFHDARVDRVSRTEGLIRDMTWQELSGVRVHGHQHVLRLEELLLAFPQVVFNIDVKESGAIRPLVQVVRRLRAHDRIVLASFSHRRLSAVRADLGPRVASSMSPREVWALYQASRGRRATLPRTAACVQVPSHLGEREIVTEHFVEAAHARGLQVHVWTIDHAAQMHRLLDLGVDAIMTDRPTVLRAVFRNRGHWPPYPGGS